MKIKRNAGLTVSKILLIPITFTIITTVIISIILHNFVSKGFYNLYLNNTKSYSKTHVEQIVSNKTLEKMMIDELNVRLLKAMNFVLDQNINDLSDELLKEVAHTFDVDELFWFKINNNNAEQVFDSSSGEKRLDVKEGDPIHNFMISDKEVYFEGIRESIIEKDK